MITIDQVMAQEGDAVNRVSRSFYKLKTFDEWMAGASEEALAMAVRACGSPRAFYNAVCAEKGPGEAPE